MPGNETLDPNDCLKANPIKADNVVDYQKGSIVSREILKGKSGNVTFFAFEKNEGLSEHTVPFDAFVYIIEGSVEVSISGVPHKLYENELIIMPGGKPHSLKALERFKMMLVLIKS